MDFAPKFLTDLLPEAVREYATFILGGGACLAVLLVLLIVISLARMLFRHGPKPVKELNLEEDLAMTG